MHKKNCPISKEDAIEALLIAASCSQPNDHLYEESSNDIPELSEEDKAALMRFDDNFVSMLLAKEPNITHNNRTNKRASEQFKEAVLISSITRELASAEYPLGRKRYQKISYFILRMSEHDVRQKFHKKAAGPYNPAMKYKGGESIAIKKGYIKHKISGKFSGFIVGDNISEIDTYLTRYDFASSIEWAVKEFRYIKNDELELLATVDYASLELISSGEEVTANKILNLIKSVPEWVSKLERTIFSKINIQRAINSLKIYFPDDYDCSNKLSHND